MNMGKMKARTSQIGEAVDRFEKLTEKIYCRLTGPEELKDLSVSIVSSAKRIQGQLKEWRWMEVAVIWVQGGHLYTAAKFIGWAKPSDKSDGYSGSILHGAYEGKPR